jgi:hypothetical protein
MIVYYSRLRRKLGLDKRIIVHVPKKIGRKVLGSRLYKKIRGM